MEKRLVSLLMCICMVLPLMACGNKIPKNTVFSADDLPGKTIGVQLGTTGDIYASDYEAEGSVINRYDKANDAILALKEGQIDCVILDEQPALSFVERNEDLTILEESFSDENYAICVNKDNKELTKEFNEALSELKSDGTLEQIVANYIGDDTKGTCPYVTPANTTYEKGTLTMATNATFEPYEFLKNGDIVGIDVEMARAICDKLGYDLVVEDMEFDAIIPAVVSGKCDFGAAGMTITDERLKEIDFTDFYTTTTQVIIVRKK
ncbi:MAG: transporter substrate-binding domain-containing protein [Lachnospiraceae bacterium]|nr:transporter substrate-binding domain-containing protein [Lachnospiraceae bacterium]